ncbi:MAG: DUF881 domain-containing protein [Nocardioides sp.]
MSGPHGHVRTPPTPDPQVTMSLLDRIVEQSLDPNYRRKNALRGPSPEGPERRRGRLLTALTVVVLGLLVVMAIRQEGIDAPEQQSTRESLIQRADAGKAGLARTQATIARTSQRVAAATARLAQSTAAATKAQARLRELGEDSGFVALTGPGLVVSVQSAPNADDKTQVRDEDLATLVNGMWRAGADAISINGQRLSSLSAIRNTSVSINVNGRPVSPPYVVTVLADPRTIQADFLDTSSGVAWHTIVDAYGFRVTEEVKDRLSVPAAPDTLLLYCDTCYSGKERAVTP